MKYIDICNAVMLKWEDEYGSFGEHDMYTCLQDDWEWIYRPSNETLYISELKTDLCLWYLREIKNVNSSIMYVDERYLDLREIWEDMLLCDKLVPIPRDYIGLNCELESIKEIKNVVWV